MLNARMPQHTRRARRRLWMPSYSCQVVDIDDDAVKEIARLAAEVNRSVENIGARRLHTCMERIIEEISFDAADMEDGSVIKVDVPKVQERLGEMVEKVDLSKFIL